MKLEIPEGDFAAHLFDCDGTIADSMAIHYRAWLDILAPYGCPFPEQQFYGWAGIPTDRIFEMLNEQHGLAMPVAELDRKKELAYFEQLPFVKAIPEVLAEVNRHAGKKKLGVVSGSPHDSVVKTLGYLGIGNLFEVVIGAGDYVNGKPHPEPYLLAAERLGVDPAECLVYEDGKLGVDSALAAGMKYVWIPPPWERHGVS